MTEAEVFKRATGGSMVDRNYKGVGCISNGIISCNPNIDLTAYTSQGIFTHEVGHVFGTLSGSRTLFGYSTNAIKNDKGKIIAGMSGTDSIRLADGYRNNGQQPYVQHKLDDFYPGLNMTVDEVNQARMIEEYADMFRNWVWNSYDYNAANGAGKNRFIFMDSHMGDWSRTAIFR